MTDADRLKEQRRQIAEGQGFIAALDQSGGSTPKALRLYGVPEDAYSGEEEMFAEIHAMRARIMQAPDFDSRKVLGAILFERTMNGEVAGKPVPDYLWQDRGVVPFLKVDKGLAETADGVQLMKPMPDLDALLETGVEKRIFGTKMRSVIHEAEEAGIAAVADQQFAVARQIMAHGLVPIVEPEVDIHSQTKPEAEAILRERIAAHLDALPGEAPVMLKLTIPSEDDLYAPFVAHPRVLRVVALSGGYSTDDACARLSRNAGMIASFSRALTEGLTKQMSDAEFEAALGANIDKIYRASV